jgi:hypothetical protein
MHGFEGIVGDLREAFAAKDMGKLASIVPDEMVETYALFGTAGEVVEKARRFEGVVGELCLGMPWYRVDPGFMASNYRAMLQAFAR